MVLLSAFKAVPLEEIEEAVSDALSDKFGLKVKFTIFKIDVNVSTSTIDTEASFMQIETTPGEAPHYSF